MQFTKVVKVDDARVEALTPEAFRLVLEARGWQRYTLNRIDGRESRDAWWPRGVSAVDMPPEFFDGEGLAALGAMADAHHNGSTFDAFTEVERVQALLSAVEAAERGEWRDAPVPYIQRKSAPVGSWCDLDALGSVEVGTDGERGSIRTTLHGMTVRDPDRAAREARAQLPRLVRIICGVEAA